MTPRASLSASEPGKGHIQKAVWMAAKIMKRTMMIVPRAIQEVPGFIQTLQALMGLPRSASRKRVPIRTQGTPRNTPILDTMRPIRAAGKVGYDTRQVSPAADTGEKKICGD